MNPLDVITNGKLLYSIAGVEYWSAFDKVYRLSFNKDKVIAEELLSNHYVSLELCDSLGGTRQRIYL